MIIWGARSGVSRTYNQDFDVENRLVKVTVGSEVTTFAYDAAGQRVKTVEPDGTVIYKPFGTYEEEIASGTTTKRSYYMLGGQPVALRVISGPDNDLYYIHGDHLGSTSLLTDSQGDQVDDLVRYYPFGEYRSGTLPSLTDRGYTGHQENRYIKLVYMNARWYDSLTGRFISADTIVPEPGNPQSLNRFSYSLNNPINYTDPSGHWICEDPVSCSGPTESTPPVFWSIWIWSRLPLENPEELQWYGNTQWAFENGRDHNYDNFAQGMHPGIDLIGEKRQPVYAGTTGTVKCVNVAGVCGAYEPGRVDITHGNKTLLYGHLQDIQVQDGDRVTVNTVLGYLDEDEVHVHIEIMLQDDNGTYMTNPLPYFRPHLQSELIALAVEQDDSRVMFYGNTIWQNEYDQPDLRRTEGWIYVD